MFDDREIKMSQYANDVELDEALTRLEVNSDFQAVFGDKFIEAFAITNVMQFAGYDDAARRRSVEKTLARSHFMKFITSVHADGEQARANLKELEADARAEAETDSDD